MGVWPASRVVKVDDTPVGVGEGRAAGTWTVGLALTGNIAGLSAEELGKLGEGERAALRSRAVEAFSAVGADMVIDSVADLPRAVEIIEARLQAGELPAMPG
jgi:phosphonoacetaldehyde hydrolase